MKVFYNTKFDGHYPVPVAAVVVANNPAGAALILRQALKGAGLGQTVWEEDMVELDTTKQAALVLADGNY